MFDLARLRLALELVQLCADDGWVGVCDGQSAEQVLGGPQGRLRLWVDFLLLEVVRLLRKALPALSISFRLPSP